MVVNLEDFKRETECVYKGEHYSVRDNGGVLRHAHEGKRPRPTDNKWTFGKPNTKTGYLEIASERVHRIVATAFHGNPPTEEHVVDHIDTNKQNNRPENLRWVTRLENVILNPITAKRIALVCGSVEAFLTDPAKFRNRFQEPNLKWMQTVSAEEAKVSKERLLAWAISDKPSSGMALDDWIFKDERKVATHEQSLDLVQSRIPSFVQSKTSNAVQRDWTTPTEFPCCPDEVADKPILSYGNNLETGQVFSRNQYGDWVVADYAIAEDGNTLWVMSNSAVPHAIKPWSLAQVTYEENLYVHTGLGSFFKKDGAEKYFTLAQGLEWTGGEVFDDFV
jgi:hypothetical protein